MQAIRNLARHIVATTRQQPVAVGVICFGFMVPLLATHYRSQPYLGQSPRNGYRYVQANYPVRLPPAPLVNPVVVESGTVAYGVDLPDRPKVALPDSAKPGAGFAFVGKVATGKVAPQALVVYASFVKPSPGLDQPVVHSQETSVVVPATDTAFRIELRAPIEPGEYKVELAVIDPLNPEKPVVCSLGQIRVD